MIDWTFVLVPVLVLLIVLLFRFTGCGVVLNIEAEPARGAPPAYRDYILTDPAAPPPGDVINTQVKPNRNNVIGYWRLVDPETIKVSADVSTQAPAKDEKGFQDGIYVSKPLALQVPTPGPGGVPGSEAAPGDFKFGQGSLIASDPTVHGRIFNGGYVVVPFKRTAQANLYTDEFTIEAWVEIKWGINISDYQHMLFSAGGFYRPAFDPSSSDGFHGFSVFADRQNRWQVVLSPNVGVVFPSPPLIPRGARTHVAVSVQNEGTGKRVRLFVDGTLAGSETKPVYAPPFDAPLYIGVNNQTSSPSNPANPNQPILSTVQEVVLHNRALSAEEIQNHVDINR